MGPGPAGSPQVVKVTRNGGLTVDEVELLDSETYTVTLDTYRALASAAWEYADERETSCAAR